MLSGSAPLSANVMDFLRICFGCLVIEGYGLTETTSAVAGTAPEEHRGGHVGGPAPSVELKLADIPDMKYTNADLPSPRGEVSQDHGIKFLPDYGPSRHSIPELACTFTQ